MRSLDTQRERVSQFSQFLAVRGQRLEQAGGFVREQFQSLENELKTQREEAERWREQHDALTERLNQTESRLAEAEEQRAESLPNDDGHATDEDLRRRYETAMEDLREANDKNTELQQQLSKTRSSAAKLAQQSRTPGWLDWETEKQRILAALEDDTDEDDQARKSNREETNEVLRITDEVVATKDREIQELKQRLEEEGRDSKAVTAAEALLKQTINSDEAVQQERSRLQELQKEWQEKLRQAEVELSLERATIARERAVLDEQLRVVDDASSQSTHATSKEKSSDCSASARWMTQLGLTAADREPARRS